MHHQAHMAHDRDGIGHAARGGSRGTPPEIAAEGNGAGGIRGPEVEHGGSLRAAAGNVNGAPQVSGAVSGKGTAAFHVHGALLLPVIGIQAQGAPVVGRRVAGKGGTRRYLHVPAAVERAAAATLRPVAGKGNGGLLDYGTCVNRSALGEAAHRVIFIGGGAGKSDLPVIQYAAAVARLVRIAGAAAGIDQHIRQQKGPGEEGGGPKANPEKTQTTGKNGKTTCFLHESCPVGEKFIAGWERRRKHHPGPFHRDR